MNNREKQPYIRTNRDKQPNMIIKRRRSAINQNNQKRWKCNQLRIKREEKCNQLKISKWEKYNQ